MDDPYLETSEKLCNPVNIVVQMKEEGRIDEMFVALTSLAVEWSMAPLSRKYLQYMSTTQKTWITVC